MPVLPFTFREKTSLSGSRLSEGWEELAKDLVVTGKGIKSLGQKTVEAEATTSRVTSTCEDGMEGLLTVSGVKVSMPRSCKETGGFEFPGFASQKEQTITPMQGQLPTVAQEATNMSGG
jgi:hypothetical protein